MKISKGENKMANKKILLGMLVITLVFGMTVVGCDDSTDDKNPYVGAWTTVNFTLKKTDTAGNTTTTENIEATIKFTETEWTLTTDEEEIKGTYALGTLKTAILKIGTYTVANCLPPALDSLVVAFNSGDYEGSTGNFERVKEEKPATDPFIGTWTGTLKKSGQTDVSATIVFTETNWTLTGGSKTMTGTYKKSEDLGVTASLTEGTYKVGSCFSNIIKGSLTVSITNGNFDGYSGTFTRQ
jgi:hypothetical protein